MKKGMKSKRYKNSKWDGDVPVRTHRYASQAEPAALAQYERLAQMMSESKGKVMLSINDHPDIRELFKDFRTTRLEFAYSVGRDKTQKTSGELVICNW